MIVVELAVMVCVTVGAAILGRRRLPVVVGYGAAVA
jgi:hypothetical protein